MKVKKMNGGPLKSPKRKTLAITRKKKRNLNKLIIEMFQYLENYIDSNVYDSEIDKNTIYDEDSEQLDRDMDSNSKSLDSAERKKLTKLQDTKPDFYDILKETERYQRLRRIVIILRNAWPEVKIHHVFCTTVIAMGIFHKVLNVIVSSNVTTRYETEKSSTFNGIVQLCITYLPQAFGLLKLGLESQKILKSEKSEKIEQILKRYLSDLVKLLQNVPLSNSAILVLLKHLHQMLPYPQSLSSLTKPLLKILLKLWSTAESSTLRAIAFLNILHIATSKEFVLEELLKIMYEEYVQNMNFVSFNTLPEINFMRHSLVLIYLMLDYDILYSHAFLHIRKLAINLRNAVTLKNKENLQAIYNWQYINSLRFWTELINNSKDKSILQSLLYPLIQIIIGTIKINPTAQYYPLRFHCLEMLIAISKKTETFIPILPFLLEILDSYDFNKRHKVVMMKPISLVCILKISKSQLVENDFKDSIIETIYQLILEHAASESHRIYFPDLYTSCIIQLKRFLEKCHVAIYCKKMKQLLTMIEENKRYIEIERNKTTVNLKNMAEVKNWENRIKTDGTAIAKFYASYIKLRKTQEPLMNNEDEFCWNKMKFILDKQNVEDSEKESEFDFQVKEKRSEIRVERPLKKLTKNKKKK